MGTRLGDRRALIRLDPLLWQQRLGGRLTGATWRLLRAYFLRPRTHSNGFAEAHRGGSLPRHKPTVFLSCVHLSVAPSALGRCFQWATGMDGLSEQGSQASEELWVNRVSLRSYCSLCRGCALCLEYPLFFGFFFSFSFLLNFFLFPEPSLTP